MKTELKAKYLHHLVSKKKKDEGFTLVELLVVVIIIGVLAAVALPTMLGQANRAREAGAKSNLSVINRAQQAFNTEFGTYAADNAFGAGDAKLGIDRPVTPNYTFATANTGKSVATKQGDNAANLRNFCADAVNSSVAECTAPAPDTE